MLTVKRNIRPEEVSFDRKHVLFVEGDFDSMDYRILSRFLCDIKVQPMQKSYWIKSVAEALAPVHPTYYFLIDKDHHSDDEVNRCWREFPNPNTFNLIIWRKREIENYFLDPNLLSRSRYLTKSTAKSDLQSKILESAQKRLFINIANQVIVSVREELKSNWIKIFTEKQGFSDKHSAINILKKTKEFEIFRNNVGAKTAETELIDRFESIHELVSKGDETLSWDRGNWISMLAGKEILNDILNSTYFKVKDVQNNFLQGKEKVKHIISDLIKNGDSYLPDDFMALKKLIKKRMEN
jgi:hypothetical protein